MKRIALAAVLAGSLAAVGAAAQEGPRRMGETGMMGDMGAMMGDMGPMMGDMGPMMGDMGPMMGGAMMGDMGAMHGSRGLDFAAIDSDGNGSLSRAELQARAVARIAEADANGDGALDREEIIAMLPGPRPGIFDVFAADPAAGMADRILAMLGATEAGQVAVDTLAGHRVNMLLAFVDADRDAAVSQAEAGAMAARGRQGGHHRWMERDGSGDSDEGRGSRS
jgi:hypothetical protein